MAAGVSFVQVHVATDLEICDERDSKGLYARARSGELPAFTGISAPYEPRRWSEIRSIAQYDKESKGSADTRRSATGTRPRERDYRYARRRDRSPYPLHLLGRL